MNNNQVQLPLHVFYNVNAHVPTYFLSDILMLQVDSLWTALRTEGTKLKN